MERSVPKRRHIKSRPRGITRKEDYNIHNMAKVLSEGRLNLLRFTECSLCHHIKEENMGRAYSMRGMNENCLQNLRGWRDETREWTIARGSLMFAKL